QGLVPLFVFGDDLQQHLPGQVLAGAGVADLERHAVEDELAHVLQRDVAGNAGAVQPAVRVLLDQTHATFRRAARLRGWTMRVPRGKRSRRPAQPSTGGRERGMRRASKCAAAASRNASGPAPDGSASAACPSRCQASWSEGNGSPGSSGRSASDLESFLPSRPRSRGRCKYAGVGRPSARCSSIWRGVEPSRSAPRTTSVTPCAASSTTTASWYAQQPSARKSTKSPTSRE